VKRLAAQAQVEAEGQDQARLANRFRTRRYVHQAVSDMIRKSRSGSAALQNLREASHALFTSVDKWHRGQSNGNQEHNLWTSLRRMLYSTPDRMPHRAVDATSDRYIRKLQEGVGHTVL
jgi:hypothetical protein